MKGPIALLLALAGAFATFCFLGRGAPASDTPATDLTEGWRFVADQLAAGDPAALAAAAPAEGLHPGTPWRTHPALTDVAGGTFVLDYRAPDTLGDYGLRVPAFYGAYRVYFDGRLVGGRGTPTLDRERHADYVASEVIALPRRPRTTIVFEAATHDIFPGGGSGPLVVDDYALLKSTEDRVVALTLFVIGLLTAVGFTVFAAAYGSRVTARQQAFGALAVLVAGFVAFNDTGLLAAQWLLVPYEAIYRTYWLFFLGAAAAVMYYAEESAAVVAYPRLRRAFPLAMAAAALVAVALPMAWSSRVLPVAYAPMALAAAFLSWRIAVAPGWRDGSVALARVSLVALGAGMAACSVTEIGVDQGRGLTILACFVTFAVVGAAQFIRELVRRQGGLLAEAQASDIKTQFMARVSHELRTPLHGVIGLSRMIRSEALSQNQTKYLDALDVSTTAMEVSVAGLLDYEDIRSGRLEIAEGTADVPEVLAEALSTGSIQLPDGVKIGLRDFSGVKSFTTDARRFRDALAQLVDNAVRHGHGEHPMVHVTREGERLRVLVRSGGPTLTAEEVARAFAPFTQAENYWGRERGGLGLGLSMATALAQRLGGDIEHVPLERGNGFALELPLRDVVELTAADPHNFAVLRETSAFESYPSAPAAKQARGGAKAPEAQVLGGVEEVRSVYNPDATAALATAAATTPPTIQEQLAAAQAAEDGGADLRILIVEDHPINQLLARKMVESWGYSADVAADGQAAIDAIEPGRYDLVLMDLQMPVLDGISATRRLREMYPAEMLPIVALTANASAEDREACATAGMQDFLSKPFKAPELKAIVEALVGSLAR